MLPAHVGPQIVRAAHGAAGGSAADAFVADVIAAADSQLIGLWLAENTPTYRTISSGVSALLDQVGSRDLTQSTASQRPAMDAGNGPNGRDRITFTAASSQFLASALNSLAVTSGDRFGLLLVAQGIGTPGSQQQMMVIGDSATANYTCILARTSSAFFSYGHATSTINVGAFDTSVHTHEGYIANPHTGYLDGSAGINAFTDGAPATYDSRITLGSHRVHNQQFSDMHFMCGMAVKLSGTSPPSWLSTVRGLIDTYYGL